jgi:hypothetical protein
MADRITNNDLQKIVDRINRILDAPATPYGERKPNGDLTHNVGNHSLGFAYGGVKLVKIMNADGGEKDVLSLGYVPKRALRDAMFAYIAGLYDGEQNAAKIKR